MDNATLLNCSIISRTVPFFSNHFPLIKLKKMDANFKASKTLAINTNKICEHRKRLTSLELKS